MMRALITKTLFVLSTLLSAQALAFDVDGLSYSVPLNPNDRQASVTGRASGNSATAIVIPISATGGTYNFDYSVTAIGDNAFQSNALTSVIFQYYNVTTIGAYAFADNALTSVSIPRYVETIGAYAFAENALASVIFPNNVTTIGAYAFAENALTNVIFEGNHGSFISNGIFDGNPDLAVIYSCQGTTGWPKDFITGFRTITTTEINCQFEADGLNYKVTSGTTVEVTGRVSQNFATDIVIPDTVSDGTTGYSVTSISDSAFFGDYLTSVTIGSRVKTIGFGAFRSNALTSVIIPDSVTTIGEQAFRTSGFWDVEGGGDGFTSVTIGNSVTTIGASAFLNNQLTSVIIPDSVKTIGYLAFRSNQSLASVAFKGDFGTFDPNMFLGNSNLTTITSCQGTTGWPQTFGNITTTPISCSPPDAPTISIAAGVGEAIISFIPGADNGSPITGYRYIKDDGSVTSTILGTTGSFPAGIAIDAAGNVYTSNAGSDSDNVSKIAPDGTSTILATAGSTPRQIAIAATGNVYTSNYNANTVSKIAPDGTSSILGTTGSNPYGIALDAGGNVYTANSGSDTVSRIAPDGTSSILGTTGSRPWGIALDAGGNVYTANALSNDVSKITPDGISTIFGTTDITPLGIALDAAGNVYTTNRDSDTVSKIAPDGTSSILGTTGSGPLGIALDAAGNVYTTNSGSDTVSKIAPDGTSAILGTTGIAPRGIALDAAGNVYTTNSNSTDVSKITDSSTVTFPATGDTSPITITGLTGGTEYVMSLIAVNAGGESAASNSVSVTPEATTAPDAPTIDSIALGDGQVVIAVTPGADNGLPITGYTALCFNTVSDSSIVSSSASPITVSGLNNGVSYVCLVSATNDIGSGPYSALSGPVIPAGDVDGDGVNDLLDNCVSIANPGQEPSTINPNCGEACVTSSCAGTICENH